MLNNLKETMDTTETLATLPTATLVAEDKCCNEYEIKSATAEIETTVTTTPTSSPTKGKSIFNWFKSTTTAKRNNEEIDDENSAPTKGDQSTAVGSVTTTPPNSSPQRVQQQQTVDTKLISSYCEFRGVQALRHLWNKRISAIEATNAATKSCACHSAKVKKLHKSVSCLVTATNESLNEDTKHYDVVSNAADNNDAFETSNQTAHVKRRQTRTKRAQSLVDCTQILSAGEDKPITADLSADEDQINTLHRKKDNFYKYKTAEQASKLWQQQAAVAATKRLSAGIVSGNDSHTQNFPAIKTSDKGALIHWLRRDEIEMSAKRSATKLRNAQSKAAAQESELSSSAGVISDEQTLQLNGSDASTLTLRLQRDSIAAVSECRTSESSANNSKRNSVDASGTRGRRNSSRKYSFRTHVRSYHSPRKMHACSKSSGSKGATSGSATQNFSMVAQLTQQFNALIQKDKTLLEEVKRNNGVLMSRGGHVYKVLPKTDLRPSPGVSRSNSRGKDYASKASQVRRAIRNIECSLKDDAKKPKVPEKSPHLLKKREDVVVMRSRQILGIKRPKSGQRQYTSGTRDELQSKRESTRLAVVSEEIKTLPREQGDKRSNDKVSMQNVSSFNENQRTNVSTKTMTTTTTTTTASSVSNSGNQQNVDIIINTVNQAETLSEGDDKNKCDDGVVEDVADEREHEEADMEAFVSAVTTNKTEQRLEPDGKAADASIAEPLVSHSEAEAATKADVASTPFPTVDDNECVEATASSVVTAAEKTETVDSDTVDHDVDEEKRKQRKTKYAKIYEKFRFRKALQIGQNKKLAASTKPVETEAEIQPVAIAKETAKVTLINVETVEIPESHDAVVADAKILDALNAVDQRLKGLTENTDAKILDALNEVDQRLKGLTENTDAKILDALNEVDQKLNGLTEHTDGAMVLCASGDFEQRLLPNTSFIYQSIMKKVRGNQPSVTQAVNVTLVNTIEGEQILKEELTQQLVTDATNRQHIRLIEISGESERVNEPPDLSVNSEENVPSLPCPPPTDDIYEPIAAAIESNRNDPSASTSFLYSTLKNHTSNDIPVVTTDSITEDIYQTLEEVNAAHGSVENVVPTSISATKLSSTFDGYESFEEQDKKLVPSTNPPTTTTLVRNTTDELPAIPEPKRKLSKSPLFEQKLRPAPPKPNTPPGLKATQPSPLSSTYVSHHSHSHSTAPHLIDDTDDQHYYADDENIYDIIKGSHCYESVSMQKTSTSQRTSPKSPDTSSISSNCYESITQYRRVFTTSTIGGAVGCMPLLLHKAGSTTTLSSDHNTNSIYSAATSLMSFGVDAANGTAIIDQSGRRSRRRSSVNSSTGVVVTLADVDEHNNNNNNKNNNYANSAKASSEGNSDDWVDITDNEADDNATDATVGAERNNGGPIKEQFIVVRGRTKVHRSPDWSKRVRDKRLSQKPVVICEDDSDHYYESLSPMDYKQHPTQMVQRSGSRLRRNQDLPRYAPRGSQRRKSARSVKKSVNSLVQNVSDDYDSFDTDTDEVYEADENQKNQNDSGVDTSLVKLPDPPTSKNDVYAMFKKFKKFISNKKSPTSLKFFGSQQKLYENSSQFYVEGNLYQDSPKTQSTSALSTSNKQNVAHKTPPHFNFADDYENTEFHKSPMLTPTSATSSSKQLNISDKNLNSFDKENSVGTEPTTPTIKYTAVVTPSRSESKSGQSFKTRLRNSLVGSSLDTKQLTTLMPSRSKFYIEEPSHGGSGELDSGFSEKASTSDLTADAIRVPVPPPKNNSSSTTPSAESQKFGTVTRMAKKEAKAATTLRRRTIIGIRPLEPPPPPPPATAANGGTNTSWYAECGVFKNGTSLHAEHTLLHGGLNTNMGKRGSQGQLGSTALGNGSHTSWYAEAGLYQTSDISVASSSGSSGVSTGNEACLNDDVPHSMFLNEPLYQIYSAAKLQSLSHDMDDQGSLSDGYEEIGQHGSAANGKQKRAEEPQRHSRPTALQIVGPRGPSRTLWCEIPEVIQSCILLTLTPRERALQEAKFEIITSEASYLKSLNLLRSHFMNHPVFRDTNIVSARDRKALFSHIVPVHECSERLLTTLESCWQDNIMLIGLSERIYAIAEKYFHVYIAFCEHQGRMDRTMRRLKESRGIFAQNLDLLESSANCCGLTLQSFLMMPMQRITRLPLLIDAVFSKCSPNDDEYNQWKMTLAIMNKIVKECNEAAHRCEQAYEIERIARQLEFPTTIRALAIAPVGVKAPGAKPRFLVKKGELTHLIWRGDDSKLTFGKKFIKCTIFAFLFSDLLVLTKRKGEQQFLVFDYCPRNMLTISSGDALPQLPTKDINQASKNLILMTLLENHERKTVEMIISCPSVSEQERWLAAMSPPEAETPGEKLYEEWDCPQVITTHAYETSEPDALNLEVGDVVNVTRKLPDGWYQGERIRDGAIGWFPGNHTEEVNSAHVRARNLKQRYRLLTFTATYLETQKRRY